ncbi:MAG: ferritin-like domain-containing protein [Myxococcota bacterium]|mgnify:CR=1 FL=1|nr:hypothetical protein [Deltaproteobacteria bacterium]MCP4242289.1 ferritin-like domain-containing protein [bacterium]MDP6243742.1 ferritin-like domain-containing protein [Myxococcota bacterium]MDP7075311.1 ferritin-like domain-containing protein [Myxococcota bacterium]MDP7299135.1 ferritin-like domain-containing protein [Myxococcota bacterium]
MPHPLPIRMPATGETLETAFDAIYNWNYDSDIEELRTLYANGVTAQWSSLRDLDWEREIDREAFSRTFSIAGVPLQQTRFWQNLDPDLRWQISRKTAAFMLSTFLHGEQGAMMAAGQLVSAVPDMDGKLYAATQTIDEARHVEVFAAYVERLDEIYPIPVGLKNIIDGIMATDNWTMKVMGMQIMVEGLALYSFRDMRNTTEEPLLKQLLTLVARDEARHTGFGIKYLSRVVPSLSQRERDALEDFGFEAARQLVDSRTGNSMRASLLALWLDAGFDVQPMFKELAQDSEQLREAIASKGGRRGPLQGFVLPTLKSIGLFSERIEGHFQEMFAHNREATSGEFTMMLAKLPEDLEAWAMSEGEEAVSA